MLGHTIDDEGLFLLPALRKKRIFHILAFPSGWALMVGTALVRHGRWLCLCHGVRGIGLSRYLDIQHEPNPIVNLGHGGGRDPPHIAIQHAFIEGQQLGDIDDRIAR